MAKASSTARSRPSTTREHAAYDLPLPTPGEGVQRLEEACTVIKGLWREDSFDFRGDHYRIADGISRPAPVQKPGPPLLLGGWGDRTLQVEAAHADMWNIPGPTWNKVPYLAERNETLANSCRTIGREPDDIVRSVQIIADRDNPEKTRTAIVDLAEVDFTHFAIAPFPPYSSGVVDWITEEIILPVLEDGQE